MPQNVSGDGTRGAESQEDLKESEGEETVNGDGSRPSITRGWMPHHPGRVEEFLAGRGDRDVLSRVCKTRGSYLMDA